MKKIKIYSENAVELPKYQTEGSSGMDLMSNELTPIRIKPGDRASVGTGLYMEIPEGYEGKIRPRSGLALKHGVTVLNSPGTVDSDYRSEVRVILINLGKETFYVNRGDRIAQIVFSKVEQVSVAQVSDLSKLSKTERGVGGFGHTGR